MKNTTILIIVILLFFVGIVWLQIFLSRKKNKWLGLVIPMICFLFSIMSVLSVPIYSTLTKSNIRTETNTSDGVIIEVIEETHGGDNIEKPSIGQIFAMIIPVFLVSNIPTIIFLAIYFACREKIKVNSELNKMNIQDLE